MGKGYFGAGQALKKSSSCSIRCRNKSLGRAQSPSAETKSTELTAGVSQLQLRNRPSPLRAFRFHTEGKSAWPIVLSTGIEVMKYLVRFIGSSRPLPHAGHPWRFIHAS